MIKNSTYVTSKTQKVGFIGSTLIKLIKILIKN